MHQYFTTSTGLRLHLQLDEVDSTRAWVVLLHGLHDHLGRYDHVVGVLNSHGYSVFRYDLRGHGRSGGKQVYVGDFSHYLSDFGEVVERMKPLVGDQPFFVIAQSMGALIAASWILEHPGVLSGAVFTAGLFQVNPDISPVLQAMSGLLSRLLPGLRTVPLDNTRLSRDPAVQVTIERDPLHYKGGIRARTGAELMRASREIKGKLAYWDTPVLLLHGDADALTRPDASELFHQLARTEDKTLKVYPGAYHELFQEINREEVIRDILQWLETRAVQ